MLSRMGSWGWALTQWDWCPYKKRKMPCRDRDTGGQKAIWTEGETGALQKQANITMKHWQPSQPEIQGRIFPYRFQREHGPADKLMSDLWAPDLWGNTFLLFEATRFVVLCSVCGPRKLTHISEWKHSHIHHITFPKMCSHSTPSPANTSQKLVSLFLSLRIAFSISHFTIQIIFLFLSPQGK